MIQDIDNSLQSGCLLGEGFFFFLFQGLGFFFFKYKIKVKDKKKKTDTENRDINLSLKLRCFLSKGSLITSLVNPNRISTH